MRLVRFRLGDREQEGILQDDQVKAVVGPFGELREEGSTYGIEEVALLAPVVPSKIIAVGLNYRDHAAELGMDLPGEPIMFLKPPSSVVGPDSIIIYPSQSKRLDYEVELAAIIGREAKNVSPEKALESVWGYTIGLDITARDLQFRDGQWTRAKSFDTFCPLGPWVESEVDPGDLSISLSVNGEVRQSSRTSRMLFTVNWLVTFISRVMTLYPQDVILTGTPAGVGELKPGDKIEAEIEGIGKLRCSVEE